VFGVQWNAKQGAHPYGGFGFTPEIGVSLHWGPSKITPGWQWGTEGSVGASGQLGLDANNKFFFQLGVGTPGATPISRFYVAKSTLVWGGYPYPVFGPFSW